MNKKSKEIVKKLCFTLVVVISIISIIGCQNGVSNNTATGASSSGIGGGPSKDPVEGIIEDMRIKGDTDKVVTEAEGLSFGRTSEGLCLYEGKTFEYIRSKGLHNTWPGCPSNNYFYPNIREGIEQRWIGMRDSFCKSGSHKLLELSNRNITEFNNYIHNTLNISESKSKVQKTYDLLYSGYYFVVRKNMDIFVCTPVAGQSYFADWHLVFVEKVENPKMYSFHFGPYTLYDTGNQSSLAPSSIDVGYNETVHMFTLSGMMKDYLTRKKNISSSIADQVIARFPPFKDKGNYNVYLVIGKFFLGGGAQSVTCGYSYIYSFRNVFKLNEYDNYWKDCWEKDE